MLAAPLVAVAEEAEPVLVLVLDPLLPVPLACTLLLLALHVYVPLITWFLLSESKGEQLKLPEDWALKVPLTLFRAGRTAFVKLPDMLTAPVLWRLPKPSISNRSVLLAIRKPPPTLVN